MPARRAARLVLALALLAAIGCGGDEEGAPPVRTTAASGGHRAGHGEGGGHRGHGSPDERGEDDPRRAGEPVEAHGTPPDQPPARLARASGDVVRARGPIEPGAALEAGDSLIVRGEGRADVDLADGGRIVLDRDTEIRIGDGGPAQIVLVRGALHAVVPPGPAGPRPPLRVATPAASIDLGGSGEFFAVAHASGGTWIASLSGLTTIATGEADARRRLRTLDLPPGRALLVVSRMSEPTTGPERLDDARAAGGAVFETAPPLDAARAQRDATAAGRSLDESLLWLETETRQGLELTSRHREAVRAGRGDEGMRLQRELVSHSQRLHALRQVATARWERVLAGSLQLARVPGASPGDGALAESRRDRVTSLLGL